MTQSPYPFLNSESNQLSRSPSTLSGAVKAGKVFVVSNNKCGTTTMRDFFAAIGWKVGSQKTAETLYYSELLDSKSHVSSGDWQALISEAEVFQDVPFSTPRFLPWLINHFPHALFIHTTRESEDWYASLVAHHIGRRFGLTPDFSEDGSVIWTPELEALSNNLPYRGYPLHRVVRAHYGTTENKPEDKQILTIQHEFQQKQARAILEKRDAVFFELSELSEPWVAATLAAKLGLASPVPLPHSNKR